MGNLTYMPVFIPNGFDKVMNDLTAEQIGDTHRNLAWKQLLKMLCK